MRRLLLSSLLLLLLVPGWSGDERRPLMDPGVPFRIEPVALYPGTPARRQLGALHFVRGYRLVSADPNFGGFSAMLTDAVPGGRRFTLLSDAGEGVRFTLDAKGALHAPGFFALPRLPFGGWRGADRDSEAVARDPATGQLWVSFERHNALWRYAAGFARFERGVVPPAMAGWEDNRGAEAFTRLADGRFIAIDENEVAPGAGCEAVLFTGDPTLAPRRGFRFRYLPPAGYKPTDLAELPDGRLVLLNRRADLRDGFTAIVTLVDRAAIRPGALARSTAIARFAAPAQHDNFEAIAATQEGPAIHLWIASDNNQSVFEESLLLEFRLDSAAAPQRRRNRLRPPLPPRG